MLLAVGRRPKLADLGLDDAGVTYTKTGIVADTFGRTTVDGIFAVGDVTGDTLTTHGANSIGRRAIRAIAFPQLPKLGAPRTMPNAVFCRPEIASVGMSVDEVDALPQAGRRRYVVQIADIDRGYTDDVEHGVAIVDAERFSGKILRAAIVGPSAARDHRHVHAGDRQRHRPPKLFGTVHPVPGVRAARRPDRRRLRPRHLASMPKEWWAMARGRIERRCVGDVRQLVVTDDRHRRLRCRSS